MQQEPCSEVDPGAAGRPRAQGCPPSEPRARGPTGVSGMWEVRRPRVPARTGLEKGHPNTPEFGTSRPVSRHRHPGGGRARWVGPVPPGDPALRACRHPQEPVTSGLPRSLPRRTRASGRGVGPRCCETQVPSELLRGRRAGMPTTGAESLPQPPSHSQPPGARERTPGALTATRAGGPGLPTPAPPELEVACSVTPPHP